VGRKRVMKIDYVRDADDDVVPETSGSLYQISSKEHKVKSHVIQFGDSVVGDSSEYFGLVQFLYSVGESDQVTLLLGGTGGSVEAGTQIAHAMQNCSCGVDVVVHSNCYSMHAILALCGTSLHMQPTTFLMFHNYSAGRVGKGGELHAAVKEYDKHSKSMDRHFCSPFLTDEELNQIMNDKDVYVHETDRDLKKRIKRHFK